MSRNRKKNHYSPKSFEAIGQKFKGIHGAMMADTSATIFESMLQSDAFKSLNPKQQILYVYCKAQYYGKRKPEKDYPDIPQFEGADLFYFNWDIAQEYGLQLMAAVQLSFMPEAAQKLALAAYEKSCIVINKEIAKKFVVLR